MQRLRCRRAQDGNLSLGSTCRDWGIANTRSGRRDGGRRDTGCCGQPNEQNNTQITEGLEAHQGVQAALERLAQAEEELGALHQHDLLVF